MASVRAVEYCETCAIVKDDFDEILYEFPQERHVIIVAVGEELRRKKRFNSVDRNLSRKGSMKVRKMSAALRHSDIVTQEEEITFQDHFLPQGVFRAVWSVISMIGFIYAVTVVPLRACMSDLEPLPSGLYFVGESGSCLSYAFSTYLSNYLHRLDLDPSSVTNYSKQPQILRLKVSSCLIYFSG